MARNSRVNRAAWRISVDGGRQALVRQDMFAIAEPPDGHGFYCLRALSPRLALRRAPFKDGEVAEPEQVLPVEVLLKCYQAVSGGVCVIEPMAPDRMHSLGFHAFATGRVTVLLRSSRPVEDGHSGSPGRRYILWSQQAETGSDLMLVKNFR